MSCCVASMVHELLNDKVDLLWRHHLNAFLEHIVRMGAFQGLEHMSSQTFRQSKLFRQTSS